MKYWLYFEPRASTKIESYDGIELGLIDIYDDEQNLIEEGSFIYKGIAVRKFTKKFTLAEDVIVNDASMKNGMLTISMEKVVPEGKRKRSIKIVSEWLVRGRKPPLYYNNIM